MFPCLKVHFWVIQRIFHDAACFKRIIGFDFHRRIVTVVESVNFLCGDCNHKTIIKTFLAGFQILSDARLT